MTPSCTTRRSSDLSTEELNLGLTGDVGSDRHHHAWGQRREHRLAPLGRGDHGGPFGHHAHVLPEVHRDGPFHRLGQGQQVAVAPYRSEEHTSELQSLMRISYAVFCLKKKQK